MTNTIYPRYQQGFDDTRPSCSVYEVYSKGAEPKFVAHTQTPQFAAKVVDALNGTGDPITQLRETLGVLDQVHERLHAIKAEGLPDETRRQAERFLVDERKHREPTILDKRSTERI